MSLPIAASVFAAIRANQLARNFLFDRRHGVECVLSCASLFRRPGFFTDEPGQIPQALPILERIAHTLNGQLEVRRQFKTFLEVFFHGPAGEIIKCDFAQDSPYRLQPKLLQADFGIMTDNALDISCNKLSALFDRAEVKDFVDIFFIDRELFPFNELLPSAQQKHVGLDSYWLAVALLKVEDLGPLPRMIKSVQRDAMKKFFLQQAKALMV